MREGRGWRERLRGWMKRWKGRGGDRGDGVDGVEGMEGEGVEGEVKGMDKEVEGWRGR